MITEIKYGHDIGFSLAYPNGLTGVEHSLVRVLQQLSGHGVHAVGQAVVHHEELRVELVQAGHVPAVLRQLRVVVLPAGLVWRH